MLLNESKNADSSIGIDLSEEESENNDLGTDVDMDEDDNETNASQELPDEVPAQNSGLKRKLEEVEVNDDAGVPGEGKKKKAFVKPPTAEEMTRLRETENLFKSNLFRLQIEEMIDELKPHKKSKQNLQQWIDSFRKHLLNIDEISNLSLSNFKWLKKLGVALPIPSYGNRDMKGVFNLCKPVDVVPIGSYSTGCLKGPSFSIDLAVIMPRRMFHKGDHLNQRYHLIRALYLGVIASHIMNGDLFCPGTPLQFSSFSGDSLKPVLTFRPKGKLSSHVEVVLHPIPEEGSFKIKRFYPEMNNVRPEWWGLKSSESRTLPPTPNYNSSVLEDMVMIENEKFRAEIIGNNDNLKEALTLIGVWLAQRNLDKGYGAITRFILSMYMCYLVKVQKLNNYMSSYQIIRNVWLSLAQSDWTKEGPTLASCAVLKTPSLSSLHSHFVVVFVDVTGFFNITSRVSKYTYHQLKHEAQLAMTYLDTDSINSFPALFLTKMHFTRQYDNIICFTDLPVLERVVEEKCDKFKIMDLNNFAIPLFSEVVGILIEKGLNKRVLEIAFSPCIKNKWDIGCKYECIDPGSTFLIGLKLDPEASLGLIDKGPQANLPEAEEFRSFWVDRSELRRFRDGNVCEAIVWGQEGASLSERRLITSKIIHYLFESKLGIKNKFTYMADQLSFITTNKLVPSVKHEEASLEVQKVLEELTQQLRDLNNLPLDIVSVHCISPVYRFTEIFPPLPSKFWINKSIYRESELGYTLVVDAPLTKVPPYISPVDLVIQLSMSGKWPNDIAAGKRLIAAFIIAISSSLKKQKNVTSQITSDCLIVHKGGYAFRIYLGYSKEISLLKQYVTALGVTKYRDTPQSIMLEQKFINLPKCSGALHGASEGWSGLGGAACLAKRWVSAQLLDESHFPSIVIELLVAHLFLSPHPYKVALQPQTAFLRFLSLLATTNWHIEPIIVNFNNLLTKQRITEIEKHFTTARSKLPAMFIATPYDTTGTLWTQNAPTLPTLVRVAKLAATALQILEHHLTTSSEPNKFLDAFRPPMSAYDAVIKIDPRKAARRSQNIGWKIAKQAQNKSLSIVECPVIDFDPVTSYVKELQENYGDYALFFYDIYGGLEIGVLFKPDAMQAKEFKVSQVNGRKIVDGKLPLLVNMATLISDFKVLGSGIVEWVELKEQLKKLESSKELKPSSS